MKRKLGITTWLCSIVLFLICQPQAVCASHGDHEWGPWLVGQEPNCIDEGYLYRVCEKYPDSPDYEYQVLPPTGAHTYEQIEVPPTCTADGEIAYTCTYCGYTYTEEVLPALGHQYGDWQIVREPTTNLDGLRRRVCAHDSTHVEEEVIPMLPTPEVTIVTPTPAKEPVTPLPPVPVEEPATSWNTLDVVLTGSCTTVGGILFWLIGLDLYVLHWDRKRRKELIKERGYFVHVIK